MRKLGQASAAWLLGTTTRSLRDWADVPRNEDGSYDARELLNWGRNNIPVRDWVAFTGRQPKEAREQAAYARLPLSGSWVHLPSVAKAVHDFVALARTQAVIGGDDPAMQGEVTPGLERYRLAKAELAEMDVRARRGDLLDRGHIHELLGSMASILRQAGQTLQRSYGADAQLVLDGAIDDIVATAQRIGTEQVQALPVEGVAADAGGT